jgi:HEAT repeat protein
MHLAAILAAIGEPAVPTLTADAYLRQSSSSARRYVMKALGRVGSDRAVDALASMLSAADWQDRGVAASALGVALAFRKNERARPALERARGDPDEFVRRKVEEALAGKTKDE